MEFLNGLLKKINKKNIQIKGCTSEQIEHLLSIAGGKNLPKAYMEFMSIMGNGTDGQYMGGDSCFLDEIDDLKQGALELLEENESKNVLTENDFVFWMSQGCMFCFFKLDDGDNPPVYFYNESGEDRFVRIAKSLVEFLINRLDMNKNLFKGK